jgi:anti-sigma factor RsiW
MILRLIQKSTCHRCGHFSDGLLMRLDDDEIPARRRICIEEHLNRCPRCRDRVDRLRREWKELEAMASRLQPDPVVSEQDLMERIQTSIRSWDEQNPAEQRTGDPAGKSAGHAPKADSPCASFFRAVTGRRRAKA